MGAVVPMSPAKGKKGAAAAGNTPMSPGLAPGMYNLGGGRGSGRAAATTPSGRGGNKKGK